MHPNSDEKSTHFGFKEVPHAKKKAMVANVFDSVASKYDVMNDLMSLGLHRLWKRIALRAANIKPGEWILYVASGTGDLAKTFAKQTGPTGKVILSDINMAMLARGQDRLTDAGLVANVEYVLADAEKLPFANNTFDCISVAFGLRNMTDKDRALEAMYRTLKPGGKLLILEFSKPSSNALKKLYDFYSFHCIPRMGEWIAKDRASYQYLVESIRKHPDQETLKSMMQKEGFEDVSYLDLSGGIVALHKGFKY